MAAYVPQYNSLILEGKVLANWLCLEKHILGLGTENVQNIFADLQTSLEITCSDIMSGHPQ